MSPNAITRTRMPGANSSRDFSSSISPARSRVEHLSELAKVDAVVAWDMLTLMTVSILVSCGLPKAKARGSNQFKKKERVFASTLNAELSGIIR